MPDLLSVGLSGLLANQTALDVTSHNISNVNTPGYSRQTVDLVTQPAQQQGSGWIGAGVAVRTITRNYNTLLTGLVRSSSNSVAQLTAFSTQASQVSALFGDSSTGISASLQQFNNAVQNVASEPPSISARTALLGQAQSLVTRLQSYDSQLTQYDTGINQQMGGEVSTINTLAQGIARLNDQIANGLSASGQPPNDLLDQRDTLLDQLSQHISVSTSVQDNGIVNVVVGNGQSLVLGTQATTLQARPDATDTSHEIIAVQTPNGPVDVTQNVVGGTLGGLIDFRSQMLDPARDAIGRIAATVAQLANQQNRSGLDLNGALGGDIFAVGPVIALSGPKNTGTELVTGTIADATALTGANYSLDYAASGWTLKRLDTGAAVTLSGAGTAASPFVADGVSIVIGGGAPAVGDHFEIQPTRAAVASMAVIMTDPRKIAAASPVTTAAATANTGSGSISAPTILDPTNPQLRTATTIQFLTANTYSVNGAGSFAYTGGGNIDLNGWRVQISGAPAVGDQFTVSDNSNGTGDNSNALKLAAIMQQPVLDGGRTSVQDAADQLVSSVGVAAGQAQSNLAAQTVINNENTTARSNATGVNLDEEATNMLRYQQAYAASAQVIKIAGELFTTLLNAARGA